MGVPEEEAQHYNREFESGRTIVTVKADGRYDEARSIMQRYGSLEYAGQPAMNTMQRDVHAGDRPIGTAATNLPENPREARRPASSETMNTDRGRTVELREDELRARKEQVAAGEVELHKEVVTEEKTIDVPVTHEEVVIDRHAVPPHPSNRPIGEDQTIRVPVREERVELEKQPVVYEEVEIGKRQIEGTEHVSGTTRREELRVENEGNVDVRGGGRTAEAGDTWDTMSPHYRQEWERRHGTSGGRWEEYEPGYRYGHEMANDPRYRDRQWSEMEPSLRTDYEDWSRRNHYAYEPDAWDRIRESAREAWEGSRARVRNR
jgi:uncharacterized protein (TIGR02271 family)